MSGRDDLGGSIGFDRAAAYYDATRAVGEAATLETIDHLVAAFSGLDAPVLEIGVGTGILAVPVAARGVEVVGIDVAPAMLAKLREKDPRGRVRTLEADARHLPFPADRFAGAYLRHVFHLIPGWERAVAELCRVVRPGGRVLVDPGPAAPEFRAFWDEVAPVLGPGAERPGLDLGRDGDRVIEAAFVAAGARPVGVARFDHPAQETWAEVLEAISRRTTSFTWRVPDDALARALVVARRWVDAHGGPDALVTPRFRVAWYAFEVA